MDFETEEQQLEAIKKWWKDNSGMIVGGVALGVTSIFGWQYYQQQSTTHTMNASVLYEQVVIGSKQSSNLNDQLAKANELQAEYSDTPYASLTALILAKQQLVAGEVIKAQQQLEWVINNTRQDELKYLAQIRLARLLLSVDNADKALQLTNEQYPDSFKALALELKGDVLLTLGKKADAKSAYVEALSFADPSNRWLQLKIDDIGSVTDSTANDTGTTEPSA